MVTFSYDNAELRAQRALVLDPTFMKARYRRGLARKGNLEFARAAVGKSLLCFTRDVRGGAPRLTREDRLPNDPEARPQLDRSEKRASRDPYSYARARRRRRRRHCDPGGRVSVAEPPKARARVGVGLERLEPWRQRHSV